MEQNNQRKYPARSDFLPTSRDEMDALGWEQADVILFSGDAYVDHPSFGAAVIGRVLQSKGFKVAIVPQPNWRDDLRDFKKLGAPRLFFGVSPGAMDSMVNHYTAARRLRHDDAYTAGGRHGMRPDYPSIVYTNILRELWPDIPIVVGGIEASLRRVSHYDYWKDELRPSILTEAKADILSYGMGERTLTAIAEALDSGRSIKSLTDLPQTAVLLPASSVPASEDIILASYEECRLSKRKQAQNFRYVEEESNKMHGKVLWQLTGDNWVKINPMYPPMTTAEIDASFDLPYTRLPHPRYKDKRIPAYEMIRHSINLHRGCFGGCAFCTISAHQGKFISSRSETSILKEAEKITRMPDFKGYISDMGGPSANMYQMGGYDKKLCEKCVRPSCLHPKPCPNLNNDHSPLLSIYKKVDSLRGVKKSFVGSGVRYDLSMLPHKDPKIESLNKQYNYDLISNHVSGRLKVAPEHTSEHVLNCMRKPSFSQFYKFKHIFDHVNRKENLNQQLIPYFISSHPGCTEEDMAELAVMTKELGVKPEQVQDFTPTPMTLATEIYYTGIHPYTGQTIFTATSEKAKQDQRRFFFWWKPEERHEITKRLMSLHRPDLLAELYPHNYSGSYAGGRNRKNEMRNRINSRKFQKHKK